MPRRKRKIDIYAYWMEPPPENSPRLLMWVDRIMRGWKPNRRIRQMGYSESAHFYGVYIWEYLKIIYPLVDNEQ